MSLSKKKAPRATKYWIVVASKDHVETGKNGGFAQACHGKSAPLARMQAGDFIVYYSGKQDFEGSKKCQAFTAIGEVEDSAPYQVQMSEDFCPFRRNIHFFPSEDASILPLIDDLEFIQNKKSWGYPFRYGILEIQKADFDLIASKMLVEIKQTSDGISV